MNSARPPLLDAGPLREFIERELLRFEFPCEAARAWGVNDRSLHAIRSGERSRVGLDMADRIVTRAGHPELLGLLWPETRT